MTPDPAADSSWDRSPWGSRAPRGWRRMWLAAVRRLPGSWPWDRQKFVFLTRRVARLGMDGPVDVRAWGFKLRLNPWGSVPAARLAFLPQGLDRPERRAVAPWLGPGSVFVDVGAHAGGYVFWAASLSCETGFVLAFEPDPGMARQLRWNVVANGAERRIAVVEAAVAAKPGKADLMFGRRDLSEGHLTADAGQGDVTVRVVALAAAVREAELARIDCLKVDVEGLEAEVLKPFFAAAPSRLRPRTLIVELGWAHEDDSRAELESWLVAQGYRLVLRTVLNGVFLRNDAPPR